MQVSCPHCQSRGELADKYEGRRVRCSSCSRPFIARALPEKPLQWFFAENQEKKGPFEEEEIKKKVAAGEIKADTLVWHRRLPRWLPAGVVIPELAPDDADEAVCSSCYQVSRRSGMMAHGEGLVCEQCKLSLLQKRRSGSEDVSEMEFAGLGERFFAKILDLLIMTVIAVGIEMLSRHFFSFHANADLSTAFIITLLVNMAVGFVYIAGLTGRFGATPGKMILGMKVVDIDGGNIGYWRAFLRYAGEFVVVPVTIMVGYLVALFDANRRTLYDRIAGTLVVRA